MPIKLSKSVKLVVYGENYTAQAHIAYIHHVNLATAALPANIQASKLRPGLGREIEEVRGIEEG